MHKWVFQEADNTQETLLKVKFQKWLHVQHLNGTVKIIITLSLITCIFFVSTVQCEGGYAGKVQGGL